CLGEGAVYANGVGIVLRRMRERLEGCREDEKSRARKDASHCMILPELATSDELTRTRYSTSALIQVKVMPWSRTFLPGRPVGREGHRSRRACSSLPLVR